MSDVSRFPRRVKRNPNFHQHHTSDDDRHWRKRRGGGQPWSIKVQRRYEIEQCARRMDAALFEDIFEFFLIAWAAHNRGSRNPVGDLMAAAKRMEPHCWPGWECRITKSNARAALDQAEDMPRSWKADELADYLGIPHCVRQELKLKSLGSLDIQKKAREELRKRDAKLRKERKRRERGAKSRTQYEADALSNVRPWEALGISRRTWERRRRAGLVASLSALPPTPTHRDASPSAIPPKGVVPTDRPATAGPPQEAIRGGADGTVAACTENCFEVTQVDHPDGSGTVTITFEPPPDFKPNFDCKPIPGVDAMTRWLEKKFPDTASDPRKSTSRSGQRH